MLSPEWVSAAETGVGVLIAAVALYLDIRRRGRADKIGAKKVPGTSVDFVSDQSSGLGENVKVPASDAEMAEVTVTEATVAEE